MTFFDKLTLLRQLECKGLTSAYTQTFSYPDLFGNDQSLQIQVEAQNIHCKWLLGNESYRSIHLTLSKQGRTQLSQSQGFDPPIKTVSQAIEHIQKTIEQMPKIEQMPQQGHISLPVKKPNPLP